MSFLTWKGLGTIACGREYSGTHDALPPMESVGMKIANYVPFSASDESPLIVPVETRDKSFSVVMPGAVKVPLQIWRQVKMIFLNKGVSAWRSLMERVARIWPLVPVEDRAALGLATFIMALTSGANTAVALLLGRLVDHVQHNTQQSNFPGQIYWSTAAILGTIAGLYLLRELLNVVRRALVDRSVARLNRDMQLKLVGHVLRGDLVSLSGEHLGALHGKIVRNVSGFIRFIRLLFLDFLPAITLGTFASLAAIAKHWWLGGIMLGVVPLAFYLTLRQLRSQKGVRSSLMQDCEVIDGTLVEQLGGAEYIRVANTYNEEMLRLFQLAEMRRKREVRHHFEMSLYGFAKALNEGVFHILVLGLATYMALHGQISFGDVLTFSVLFLNVMAPVNEIHRILDEGHETSLQVDNLLQMLQVPLDRSFATPKRDTPAPAPGEVIIVANDVSVQYAMPDGQTRKVLNRLSLAIRHGETIGIAGRSGSGKSTWIKVLLRLLHVEAGQVFLAGKCLTEVSRQEIAQLVGYVGQNPFVFSGSIHDNIAYGNNGCEDTDIRRAAELANLHEEIMQMPGNYQFQVAERGQNLSGGQRQRLALARLFLRQPPLLILDEATSALDNISERYVQHTLGTSADNRTVLIIAHRLTTLKHCNRILVFQDGHIYESGSYEELVARSGLFAELVHSGEAGEP
jgi:ATP-binding cassette subfamily B protein